MLISIDEKNNNKIQYPTLLNIRKKGVYQKPMARIILIGEILEACPLELGTNENVCYQCFYSILDWTF